MGSVSKKTGHRTETDMTLEPENLPGQGYYGGMFSPPVNRAQRRSKPKKIRRYLERYLKGKT